ncbi:MAG: uS8 family ribosomal protein [Microgenomates group bacterium]
MQINYLLGDFLIRVKNTAMAKNKTLSTMSNKQIMAVSNALKRLGYFDDVKKDGKKIIVSLAYRHKKPVITNIKLVSKPGLRIYIDTWELAKRRKPSIYLISTPKGILSSKEALKVRTGGEVIVEVL